MGVLKSKEASMISSPKGREERPSSRSLLYVVKSTKESEVT